jgi:serine/threonine protein kinase
MAAIPSVIGVGSTSCVIEQPIECSKSNENSIFENETNVVGKIAPRQNVSEEIENSERIRMIDSQNIFTIEYYGSCVPQMNTSRIIEMLKSKSCSPKIFTKNRKEKLYQLLMGYGGVAIDDLSPELRIKYPPTSKMIPIILTEVLRMVYGVYTLRNLHISHYDIHSSNILLNPDTMRLSLIDFGMMVEDRHIWEQFMKHNFMPRDYTHYPPELLIMIWMAKYKEQLLSRVLDGLPTSILSVITEGTRRDNYRELKDVIRRTDGGIYADLEEFLSPLNFPPDSRSNLYQIRCSGLLGIHMIIQSLSKSLSRQDRMEEVLVRSVIRMDSYAMGSVLLKSLSFMVLQRPNLMKSIYIKKTISLLKSLKDERIDQRIDIYEGIGEMINIFKESLSEFNKQIKLRKGVKTGELLRVLNRQGIY